jgi:transformation/transcription domain-associated protein
MRHLIEGHNSDLRPKFLDFIDSLLEDKYLIGENKTSVDSLRPLAYSTIADLIHHVRFQLKLNQISVPFI